MEDDLKPITFERNEFTPAPKRQKLDRPQNIFEMAIDRLTSFYKPDVALCRDCLLYTSDAADDMQCVDLGGRRIIKKNSTRATADAGNSQ